jgi:hypothetical protein
MHIMKEVKHMKHLRIESKSGQFSVDGSNWKNIDEIGKEEILKLVDLAMTSDFEMDPYDSALLPNPAHDIIYKNLSTKFSELVASRDRFRDECQALYREALEKYRVKPASGPF